MGASTYTVTSLAVLATFIIDDLGIDRAQFGLVIAANVLLAAVLSPITGRITDRIGGKRAILGVFLVASISYLIMGLAVAFWVMFVATVFGAWSQSGGNPSTNKLIAEDLPQGERGVVTGIKQSGVQATVFLGGLVLPSVAIAVGWRGAYLLLAGVPVLLALFAAWVVPHSEDGEIRRGESARPLPRAITWLAGYGFLLGFAGSVSFLVPLFAEEELGLDPRAAGVAAAVIGLTAFLARIGWARVSELLSDYMLPLTAIALLSVASAVVMLASPTWGTWLLWLGAVLIGVSSAAWNAVGMLAVMNEAGAIATGRASGTVVFGFLAGLGLGPPIYGAIVDSVGYDAMWLLSTVVATASVGLMVAWRLNLRSVGD